MGSLRSAQAPTLPTGVIGLPNRPSSPRRLDAPGWQIGFALGSLVLIGLIGWATIETRPGALATSAWWPAAGIAVGLSVRFPRKYLPLLAAGVVLATVPVAFAAGRDVFAASWVSLAVGVETAVGALILRGRHDRLPSLRTTADLGRLLIAAAAAGCAIGLLAAALDLVQGDPAKALERVLTSPSRHAAGILLIVPLYLRLPRRTSSAGIVEIVAQVVIAIGGAAAVFLVSTSVPVAFLALVPLVWAALRLPVRILLIEMLAIAVIASIGSVLNRGPFSFADIGGVQSGLMLQLFEAAMVIVALALALSVGAERDYATRLLRSEDLFRRNFDGSIAGMILAERDGDRWEIVRTNPAARTVLGDLGPATSLESALGPSALARISALAGEVDAGGVGFVVRTPSERDLSVSLSTLGDRSGRATYAIQFLDVTESMQARRLEREELERAGEIQRALSPERLTIAAGWSHAAWFSPARAVGGDFYDLRSDGHAATIMVGDVMGKGVGAGMLAASVRAVLRSQDLRQPPRATVVKTAAVLDGDLRRSGAFVTLAVATVDLDDGAVRILDAGHGLILVVRRRQHTVERLASTDPPLGIADDWHELGTVLEAGDVLLLLSDGVLDLRGGSVATLEAAILDAAASEPDDLSRFIEALCAGAESTLDRDDVTAVALRREAGTA